ncbi:MAG: hypothetical protein ACPIOQ_82345, partial [Promethearchaeia archaeon]
MPRLQESCPARVAIESREYGGGSSFSSDDGPPPLVRTLSGRGGTESACDACACVAVFVTAPASVVVSRQHPSDHGSCFLQRCQVILTKEQARNASLTVEYAKKSIRETEVLGNGQQDCGPGASRAITKWQHELADNLRREAEYARDSLERTRQTVSQLDNIDRRLRELRVSTRQVHEEVHSDSTNCTDTEEPCSSPDRSLGSPVGARAAARPGVFLRMC